MNKRAASSGFTLIELALVVSIIGIILHISLPFFIKPLGYYRLKTSAGKMAQDLREVQQRALNEESSYYNIFFALGGSYYEVRKAESVSPKVIKTVALPSTVKIAATTFSNNSLSFTAKGTPYPRGGTVTLQDAVSGRLLYVIVASVTGRIRVSSSPPESWEVE
ncbi:MAG: prepilin-type N-terminal cleavage/methylation domain-containing protein [Thermanaeromonas sp.]|uniref:prepilin-type N-terminal cleavage/methylation domain-containing protein n=1 Tax=Thermanaeromonas sp. TaxID=2003697 RepID=UPI00243DF2DF|nr:prepilin-type N-terminal cleavage/methylation domain-containing protein [Thermanaeromonas sp.]MCG0277592.1 prepilin-type N-terminal cleavage/methylation domain-containing protein [Thermanaeromonas sp.]